MYAVSTSSRAAWAAYEFILFVVVFLLQRAAMICGALCLMYVCCVPSQP